MSSGYSARALCFIVKEAIGEARMAADPGKRASAQKLWRACAKRAGLTYSGYGRRHGLCPFFLHASAIENGRNRLHRNWSVASFLIHFWHSSPRRMCLRRVPLWRTLAGDRPGAFGSAGARKLDLAMRSQSPAGPGFAFSS